MRSKPRSDVPHVVRAAPFSSSSPLRHIGESYRWTTTSPWCFDPVPIHSCSRSGRGSGPDSHVLTLALPDNALVVRFTSGSGKFL